MKLTIERYAAYGCMCVCLLACLPMQTHALTLSDAARQALANDPGLKRTTTRVDSAKLTARSDLAGYLPNINANAAVTRNESRTKYEQASTDKLIAESGNYGASLSQFIWDGNKHYSYKGSKSRVGTEELRYDKAVQDLVLEVIEAYFNVLSQQGQLETTIRQLKASENNNRRIKREFQLGSVGKAEVSESDVQLQTSKIRRIDIVKALRKAEESLIKLVGISESPSLAFDDERFYELMAMETDWVDQRLLKNNYDLRILNSEKASSEYDIKARKQGHWPTLTANVNYNANESFDEQTGSPKPTGESDSTTYSVNLNLPLYAGGATTANVKKSQTDLQAKLYEIDDKQLDVYKQAQDLTTEMQLQKTSMDIIESKIEATKSAYEATKQSYEAGTRTFKDVLEAENKVYEALREHTDTKYKYVQNHFRLKALLGSLSQNDINDIEKLMVKISNNGL